MDNWSETGKGKKPIEYPTIIKQVCPIKIDTAVRSVKVSPLPPSLRATGAEWEVRATPSPQMEGVGKVTPQRKTRELLPEGKTDAGQKNSKHCPHRAFCSSYTFQEQEQSNGSQSHCPTVWRLISSGWHSLGTC